MKLILLLCSIVIFPLTIAAQKNMGEIKGVIYDSINDYALQSASVSVFKRADSTVIDFQLSNTSGEFHIKSLPHSVPMYMVITHTGYRPLVKNVLIDSLTKSLDLKRVILLPRAENEMDEVIIKVVQPIRMNGDTLEINPNAFNLDSNAVVEDMLMRVPGLTVWGDGTITMNGRPLDKVYVDGKPFFGGSAQTATQNLPKNAIDKIQVYQEKDLSKLQESDDKADSLFAMNIKLKEDKKSGSFGKVGAGYGTDDRYTGDGVIQFYNKRTQAGFAAGINNINKEEGTGENAFLANTFKSNFVSYFGGRGGSGNGITRRIYANAKVQHNFSESDNSQFFSRLSGDYGFLNTSRNVLTNTTNIQNIGDYKLSNLSDSRRLNNESRNNVKFMYENRKQYGNFVNLTVDYRNDYSTSINESETGVFRNDSISVSRAINSSNASNSGDYLSVFGFIRSNDAGQLQDPRKNFMLMFNGGYSRALNNSNTVSRFISDIDTIPSDLIDRRYRNDTKNYYAGITLNYDGFKNLLFGIYNFFDIDISLVNELNISRNQLDAMITDLDIVTDKYMPNRLLTNHNTLTNFQYQPGLSFRKSINKSAWEKHNYWLSFALELKYRFLDQKNESSFLFRDINRRFKSFAPSFNVNFNYNKNNAFRINSYLRANVQQNLPGIDQLYPLVDSTNRYNVIAGNPDLEASTVRQGNWNINLNRANREAKSDYSVGLRFNYSNTSNAVSDNTVYDSSGRSIRYLVNVDHQQNFSGTGSLRFSTKLNKLNTLSLSYSASVSSNTRPGFINYVSSTSKNNSVTNTLNATYSLADKFNITLGETIAYNQSEQRGKAVTTSVIRNYTTTGNMNYFVNKSFSINTSVDYQDNRAANGNSVQVNIWNAHAVYRFMQQKAEIKLSAFDLLRQNRNIENFIRENSATTVITNGLQQYFMATFSFYPRKFGRNVPPPPPRVGGVRIR